MTLEFNGFIRNLSYSPKFLTYKNLKEYYLVDFDSNECASIGKIIIDNNDFLLYSKWVTPKRTRSYPFARLYNIFNTNSKIITIIPIIKDEGGDSDNNDRINAITLSWMNLLNIYIILGYYEDAKKKRKGTRKTAANIKKKENKEKTEFITDFKFNNDLIKQKIEEISNYKMSALHWNTKHFQDDFESIWIKSVDSYRRISKDQNVKLHSFDKHLKRLNQFKKNGKFDLDTFKKFMNKRSEEAQHRESLTIHDLEVLNQGHNAKFFIKNYLGGIYYLTCDEIFIEDKRFVIQESKNSKEGKLPSNNDIKDGLFKLILFNNIEKLEYGNQKVQFKTQLKLTGNIKGSLLLPNTKENIEEFVKLNELNIKIIKSLNEESVANNISIFISTNKTKKYLREKTCGFFFHKKGSKIPKIKSPLRYPGGKSKALKQILPIIPKFSEYREPFVGGGSVFIALRQMTKKEITFKINDLNYELYCFWITVKNNLDKMVKEIKKIKKENSSGTELYQKLFDEKCETEFDRGVRFFILNRITFSGLAESGGYSEQSFKKRFTESSIERLADLNKIMINIEITGDDYKDLLLQDGDNVFIFLDPPYLTAAPAKLYGKNGDLHTDFNHKKLAETLKECEHKWLMTYDDCEEIRDFYDFAYIKEWKLQYAMGNYMKEKVEKGNELFISNYPLKLPKFKRIDEFF